MKKIYFVRHGESEGNASGRFQPPHSPLTEKGRRQAAFIAQRVSHLPIMKILSSTLPRAAETAQRISEKIALPIEYSDVLIEMRRPSEQIGLERNSTEALKIDAERIRNFENPEWHYSDEENFFDLGVRAQKALALIAEKEEDEILVVTHGMFLRALLAEAIFGSDLTAQVSDHIIRTFHTANTGLSVLIYDESKKHPWWLWIWNDHAHLAE